MLRLAGLLVVVLSSTAIAGPRIPAKKRPAATATAPQLRVVRLLPGTGQAVLRDAARGTQVVLSVGEKFAGYTLIEVEDATVTLALKGKQLVLSLEPAEPTPTVGPAEAKPIEAPAPKPTEAKPTPATKAKPSEAKPTTESKLTTEAKQVTEAEAKPSDAKPTNATEAKPTTEATPSTEAKPSEAKPTEAKPTPAPTPSTDAAAPVPTKPATDSTDDGKPSDPYAEEAPEDPYGDDGETKPTETTADADKPATPAKPTSDKSDGKADKADAKSDKADKADAKSDRADGRTDNADDPADNSETHADKPAGKPDGPQLVTVELTKRDVAAALEDFGSLVLGVSGELTPKGARIETVVAGSLFARVGLRAGDLVVSVDNKPVRSLDDAADLYARAGSLKALTVQVVRGGKPITLKVVIR